MVAIFHVVSDDDLKEMYGLSKETFFEAHIKKNRNGCRNGEETTTRKHLQGVRR